MHRLLKRQLARCFPDGIPPSEVLAAFIEAVNDSYESFSEDEAILGRSLDISSQELNERNDLLNTLLDALPDTCLWLDETNVIRDIRPGQYLAQLFGDIEKYSCIDTLPLFREHPQFFTHLDNCRRLHRLEQHECRLKRNGETLYIELRCSPLKSGQVLILFRDITVRKVVERLKNAALEESKRSSKQLQELINGAPIGIMLIDPHRVIIMVNSYCATHLGMRQDDLLGQCCDSFIAPPFREEYLAAVDQSFEPHPCESRIDVDMCSPSHPPFAVEIAFSLFHHKGHTLLTQAFSDISERKQMERELRRLAQTDPLTGVANRRHFTNRAQAELESCLTSGAPLSLLSMDLDHFKGINDTYGHAVGDEVLKAFCRMLERVAGSDALIGRFGGEEFTLLLPRQGREEAQAMAARILTALHHSGIETQKGPLTFTTSIGIATREEAGHRLETLLNIADDRLYLAKSRGRNRYCSG